MSFRLTCANCRQIIGAARAAVGWDLQIAASVETLPEPSANELSVLRALNARTKEAHSRPVEPPA